MSDETAVIKEVPKPKTPAKPKVAEGHKLVTAEQDLRVVTSEYFSVFTLAAGVATELPEEWAFEAQRTAAEKKVGITVE